MDETSSPRTMSGASDADIFCTALTTVPQTENDLPHPLSPNFGFLTFTER
jgi:hypothetical protein